MAESGITVAPCFDYVAIRNSAPNGISRIAWWTRDFPGGEDQVSAARHWIEELLPGCHCAPHLHAAAATAVPNLRHLEWFHDHVRIESLSFDGALDPSGGVVTPDPGAPGLGLTLRASDAERYRTG